MWLTFLVTSNNNHNNGFSGVVAWTPPIAPLLQTATKQPVLCSKIAQTSPSGHVEIDDSQHYADVARVSIHDDNPQIPSWRSPTTTSRRQWLSGIVTAATSSTGVSLLAGHSTPANAAAAAAAGGTEIKPTPAICDPTVSCWRRDGRTLYLLGTAHISTSSAELAGQLVRDTRPDAVFVELDLKRVGGTSNMAKRMQENGNQITISTADNGPETKPTRIVLSPVGRTPPALSLSTTAATTTEAPVDSSTTAVATIASSAEPTADSAAISTTNEAQPKQKGGFLQGLGAAVVGKGIRSMYSKLGAEGFNPGEEFVVAIREGQKFGAAIVLGDQDVDVTLRRMAQAFQQTDFSRLLNPDSELEQSMREMLPTSTASSRVEGISQDEAFRSDLTEYVETMKSKENVKRIMGILKQEAPAIYQVMVTERDAYMAAGLNTLNEFAIITAVMGLAHIDGVENNLRNEGWRPVRLQCLKLV